MSGALDIGLSGIRAAQYALDVTGHNIANASTPGFNKLLVEFKDQPFPPIGGVTASSRPSSSAFNQNQALTNISTGAYYDKMATETKPVTDMLSNDTFLNAIRDFANSIQDLADNPTSMVARETVVAKANTMGDSFNTIGNFLQQAKQNISQASNLVQQEITTQMQVLKDFNEHPSSNTSQVNQALYKLAELTGVRYSVNSNGTYDIQTFSGGQTKALQDMQSLLNQVDGKVKTAFDQFQNTFNQVHAQGVDLNGNQAQVFFTNGKVSVTPDQIGAADISALGVANSQNNVNALKLAPDSTLRNSLANIVTDLAGSLNNSSMLGKTYSDAGNKFIADNGVNLDEEAVNLVKFRQMYEANAQVIKTQDEMFQTLINIRA